MDELKKEGEATPASGEGEPDINKQGAQQEGELEGGQEGQPEGKPESEPDKEAKQKEKLAALRKLPEKEGLSELDKAIYRRDQINRRIEELGGEKPEGEPEGKLEGSDLEEKINRSVDERFRQNAFDHYVETHASTETEAELIKEIYRKQIKPTGNIAQDYRTAFAIANADTAHDELTLLRKAASGNRKPSGSSGEPYKGEPDKPKEVLNKAEIEELKKRSYGADGKFDEAKFKRMLESARENKRKEQKGEEF